MDDTDKTTTGLSGLDPARLLALADEARAIAAEAGEAPRSDRPPIFAGSGPGMPIDDVTSAGASRPVGQTIERTLAQRLHPRHRRDG